VSKVGVAIALSLIGILLASAANVQASLADVQSSADTVRKATPRPTATPAPKKSGTFAACGGGNKLTRFRFDGPSPREDDLINGDCTFFDPVDPGIYTVTLRALFVTTVDPRVPILLQINRNGLYRYVVYDDVERPTVEVAAGDFVKFRTLSAIPQ